MLNAGCAPVRNIPAIHGCAGHRGRCAETRNISAGRGRIERRVRDTRTRRNSGCAIASYELPRADAVVWSGHSGVEVILEVLNLHGASVGRSSKGTGRCS